MYRYMQRMPECTYKDKHYFSASNMIFMLKLCTSNSCLEDFKLLNNELLELEGNDVYAKEVKQGYTAFINFRYDKTRDGSNDNDLFVPTPRLSESALNTLKTLMIREIQNQN